jgi:hypothetical protein
MRRPDLSDETVSFDLTGHHRLEPFLRRLSPIYRCLRTPSEHDFFFLSKTKSAPINHHGGVLCNGVRCGCGPDSSVGGICQKSKLWFQGFLLFVVVSFFSQSFSSCVFVMFGSTATFWGIKIGWNISQF